MGTQTTRPPFYRWLVTIQLEPSTRLPEKTLRFYVDARGHYRAMLWGLQKLNGGQRKRVRSARVDLQGRVE